MRRHDLLTAVTSSRDVAVSRRLELLLRAAETCGVTMFELLLRAAVALRCVRRLGRAGWLSSDATLRKSVLNQCAAPYIVVV